MFDFSLISDNASVLLRGLALTVQICAMGICLSLIGGGLLLAFRSCLGRGSAWLYDVYVTVFRGTPFLVQIYLVYFGGPYIGLDFSAEVMGIVGLAMYGSAYFAEIFRAGVEAISRGQLEAARDLGLTRQQTLRMVVIPQMFARCIPPLVGQTVILVKESSVLSIITVPELMTAAMRIANESFSILEPYLVLALSYWALTLLVSRAGRWMERRYTQHLSLKV